MRSNPPAPTSRGLLALVLVVLVLAQASLYGLCVQDDTFISLRYAANLAHGHGLVFNPGERVEGYTNLLWTLGLAAGIALGANGPLLAVAGGLLSLCGLVLVVMRLGEADPGTRPLTLSAALFTALLPPFVLEAAQGLESALFSLGVSALLLEVLRACDGISARAAALGGLLTLCRPEGVVVFFGIQALVAGHRAWTTGRLLPEAGEGRRRALIGWGAVLGVLAAQVAFRLLYYGSPLPNTFYAKTGAGPLLWLRGLRYLGGFVALHPVFTTLALGGALSLLRREPRAQRTALLLGLPLGCALYVVAVGGDFKPTFRFVMPVLGPLALLAQEGLGALWRLGRPRGARALGLAALALLGLDLRGSLARMQADAALRARAMEDWITVGAFLRDHTPPDTVLALHSVGTVPYVSGLRALDCWGLTNTHIARSTPEALGAGMAGHEKTDYNWIFAQNPHIYLPEEDLLTATPVRLKVPTAFPADFEQRYRGSSIQVDGRWLNAFFRREDPVQLR